MHIFTDASGDPQTKKGIGCYLIINDLNENVKKDDIICLEFNDVTSTIAELKTINHILNYVKLKCESLGEYSEINIYTDCENFVNLIKKRQYDDKIKSHKNYVWYKEIIDLANELKINIIWVKGHSKQKNKHEIHQIIFAIVDKHCRKILRRNILRNSIE